MFVVDDDVDIFDEREVLWAFATRAHFDKDLICTRRCSVDDDESDHAQRWCRNEDQGVDPTLPPSPDAEIPSHYQMPMRVPREAVMQTDLGSLVPGDKIKNMVRES